MELALYAPGWVITAGAHSSAGGRFITAPELSPLFGRTAAAGGGNRGIQRCTF
jgi:SAM-dependent MidA family methyltransferase